MRRNSIQVKKFAPYLFGVLLFIGFSILPVPQVFSNDAPAGAEVNTNNRDSGGYVSGLTSARARSLVGVVIALVSVVIGWRSRSRKKAGLIKSKTLPMMALCLAGIAIVLSVIHLVSNTGAFGSGGGKAGAIVALAIGIPGVIVNAMVLWSGNWPQANHQ